MTSYRDAIASLSFVRSDPISYSSLGQVGRVENLGLGEPKP